MRAAERRQKLRSKWSKNDQQKEIDMWVRSGIELQDTSRHSGHLPDNITEQRMLINKLQDLSKERYKFMTQTQFDKKLFLDRQQRKSRVMKEMLVGVTVDGQRKSWSAEAYQRMTNSSSREKNRPRSQDDGRCEYPGECGVDHSKEHGHHSHTPQRPVEIFKTEAHKLLPSINLFPSSPRPDEQSHALTRAKTDMPLSSKRSVQFSMLDLLKKDEPEDDDFQHLSSWAKKSLGRKKRPQGPLADPRFLDLSRNLSDLHELENVPSDVRIIINHNDSLYTPPKRSKLPGTNNKMAQQIRQFLVSRDWLQ